MSRGVELAQQQQLTGMNALNFANGYNWCLQETKAKDLLEAVLEAKKLIIAVRNRDISPSDLQVQLVIDTIDMAIEK